MARIPYVEIETAPPASKDVLEKLPIKLNIFKMMAHAETNFRPLLRLGTSILTEQQLPAKLRELAILRVARLSKADYEWVQHVPIAKMTGASDEQVAALARDDADAACFDPVDRVGSARRTRSCATAARRTRRSRSCSRTSRTARSSSSSSRSASTW
jgi:alkylhydroperoxidase family enzyme